MNSVFFPKQDTELIGNGQTVFSGALLLADISGFTEITDTLAKLGKEGTEELSSLLNKCFDAMLEVIFHNSGSVITFSGDSILARFDSGEHGSRCAKELLERIQLFRRVIIFDKRYSISIKVVLGMGSWNEYLVGDRERAHLMLSGNLIREIALREESAEPGEILEFTGSGDVHHDKVSVPDTEPDSFLSPGTSRLHGEYRPVTAVFFSVSSTDGQQVSAEVFQNIYPEFRRAVQNHGGFMHHVDGFVSSGSRILALFGAPVSSDTDTLNAVNAAIDTLNIARVRQDVSVSCGIDTGFVFAGMVGNSRRKQYTVIGDPVNTAARLAELSEPDTVTVSGNVIAGTDEIIHYSDRRCILLRGKSEEISIASASGTRATSLPGILPVGREEEIESLVNTISGGEKLILLTGTAGIGKTTLLTGLEKKLQQKDVRVLRTGRTRHGTASEVMSALLMGICGIESISSLEEREAGLDRFLASVNLPGLSRRKVFLGRMLLGVPVPHDTFDNLPPKLRSENLLDALILLLDSIEGNICVFVEDLHYATSEETAFLLNVVSGVQEKSPGKVTFLLTARPEGEENLPPDTRCHRFQLQGLNREGTLKLFSEFTGHSHLDQELEAVLSRKAQGNPFYLVQFLHYLREKNLIHLEDGVWKKTGKGSLDSLPESVFSMIMARMDRLGERTRESLKVASVVGMKFTEPVIGRIVERNVHPDMSESLRAGLTFVNSYAELEHIFSHMLIRDVAYDSILGQRRKQLHRDIGAILEQTDGMTEGNGSAALAYHFTKGEVWNKAADYSIKAGSFAGQEYRNREALELFSRAAAILKEHLPGERQTLADCLRHSAGIYDRIGEWENAADHHRQVISLSSDMEVTGNSLMGIADIFFNQGNMQDGLDLMTEIEKLIPRMNKNGGKQMELKVAAYRAWAYCVSGDIQSAEREADTAVEIGRSLEDLSPAEKAARLGHALNTLATVYWADSRYSQAKLLYEQAVELAVGNGLKREAAVTWGNIGLVLEKQGKYHEAVEGMVKQLKISIEIGDKLIILSAFGNLGMTWAVLGDFDKAFENSTKQKELAESMHVTHDRLLAMNHLASIHVTRDQLEPAEVLAEAALEASEKSSLDRVAAHSKCILADISRIRGNIPEAMKQLKEALMLAESVHCLSLTQLSLLALAELHLIQGELDEAEEALERSADIAEASELIRGTAACHCTRGELLMARGRLKDSVDEYRMGIRSFRELGTKYDRAKALEGLGRLLQKKGEQAGEAEIALAEAKDLFIEMGLPHRAANCGTQEKTRL